MMAIIYIFQMECIYNGSSIEQLSFKLTENLLPSATHLPYPTTSIDSLAYTLSGVSLQYILSQNQHINSKHSSPRHSSPQKESTLKTTCADISLMSPTHSIRQASFRQRVVTTHQSSRSQPIKRRLSLNIMSLGDDWSQKRPNEIPLHAPHPAPFRPKQPRKRSISGKHLSNSKKLAEWQLLELHKSIKVKRVVLENHSARQKSFIRKVIQNRSNMMHACEQISLNPQIWTARGNYRLH